MELNVNSPAYFSQFYGVDNEVYRFCQKVYHFFRQKEYSETLHIIGSTPAIAPENIYAEGKWKESLRFIDNKRCAIITVRMDFDSYYQASEEGKKSLIKSAILRAMKKVCSREKFDYDQFEIDLNSIT